MSKKVIVVGGGAAGMMAAYAAAEKGHQVLLLEQNEKLGKKVYITGKGRCNVTNACELEDFFPQVLRNDKFLYSAFYQFTNQDVMDFVEAYGCPLKIERGNRVFPVSDHSSDVLAAFRRALEEKKVEVRFFTKVTDFLMEEQKIQGVVTDKNKKIYGDAVILTTGGLSYPSTGSDGSGMRLAEEYGHSKKPCTPSLVPFNTKEGYIPKMQGLSLKNVTLRIWGEKKKPIYEEFGEMLFTHFGVSGPLVLSASAKCNVFFTDGKERKAEIDLKPVLSEKQLDERILREFSANQNKQVKNVLGSLLPSKMVSVMMEVCHFEDGKKVHEMTKEDRMELLKNLKAFPFTIIGLRDFKEAIITKGGISVKEVDPSTMESKKIQGLYFAGEILDLDAYTGGYNLQIAWSTGHLAGSSIE